MKPRIGISADFDNEKLSVAMNYIGSIESAGGVPFILPILKRKKNIYKLANEIDGLLISGGDDIHPSFYNENEIRTNKYVPTERVIFETKLIKNVFKLKKPILGICYGAQLINVVFGGTLYQDIQTQIKKSHKHKKFNQADKDIRHQIYIERKTLLNKVFCRQFLIVNSIHHQSIKDAARNFIVSAKSSDGITEAVELLKYPFLMGVQWHPEKMHTQTLLFKYFVKQCFIGRC
jgi:putative glutamine amidotransferase